MGNKLIIEFHIIKVKDCLKTVMVDFLFKLLTTLWNSSSEVCNRVGRTFAQAIQSPGQSELHEIR